MSNYKHTVYLKNPLEDLDSVAIGGKKKISIIIGRTIYIDAIHTFDSVILSAREEDFPETSKIAFHRGDEILVSGYIKSASNPEEHFIMTNKTPATVYKWWNDECLELELESCNWYAHYKQCERIEG